MPNYTRSAIPLKPVYSPEDIKDFNYQKNLNDPGVFPYTRGRSAKAAGVWIQRELSGEGEPSRSNEQLKYLIESPPGAEYYRNARSFTLLLAGL
jgi:methylmalonyl-CoA mutase N-terminal domain/subunit